MKKEKNLLTILIIIVFLSNNLFAIPEWVAGTNVKKLIELDNQRLDIEKQRAAAFSNKQYWTMQSVSYWSNRAKSSEKGKIYSDIKASIYEVATLFILTFLAGKYLGK